MSMSNATETDTLNLYFLNIDFAGIGNAGGLLGSTVAGFYYLALHAGDPGEAGNQSTNEVAYTNYARVAVARSGAGFSVSGNTVSNAALVQFPTCGVTGATATHWSIGVASSGATQMIISGALGTSLPIANTIQPQFAIGALTATAD